jgi:hypothetical protein
MCLCLSLLLRRRNRERRIRRQGVGRGKRGTGDTVLGREMEKNTEDDGPAQGLEIAVEIDVEKDHVAMTREGTVHAVMNTGESARVVHNVKRTKHAPPNTRNIDLAPPNGREIDRVVQKGRGIARAVASAGRTTPNDGATSTGPLHLLFLEVVSWNTVRMTAKDRRTGDGEGLGANRPIMIVEVGHPPRNVIGIRFCIPLSGEQVADASESHTVQTKL